MKSHTFQNAALGAILMLLILHNAEVGIEGPSDALLPFKTIFHLFYSVTLKDKRRGQIFPKFALRNRSKAP